LLLFNENTYAPFVRYPSSLDKTIHFTIYLPASNFDLSIDTESFFSRIFNVKSFLSILLFLSSITLIPLAFISGVSENTIVSLSGIN